MNPKYSHLEAIPGGKAEAPIRPVAAFEKAHPAIPRNLQRWAAAGIRQRSRIAPGNRPICNEHGAWAQGRRQASPDSKLRRGRAALSALLISAASQKLSAAANHSRLLLGHLEAQVGRRSSNAWRGARLTVIRP